MISAYFDEEMTRNRWKDPPIFLCQTQSAGGSDNSGKLPSVLIHKPGESVTGT